jgi:hypothetical protein
LPELKAWVWNPDDPEVAYFNDMTTKELKQWCYDQLNGKSKNSQAGSGHVENIRYSWQGKRRGNHFYESDDLDGDSETPEEEIICWKKVKGKARADW